MPFYEYQCGACGHHVEALQKINDSPLRKCPSCGRSMLKRLISAPVFRLKGSGWYETDFKSDKDTQRNLAADKPEPVIEAPKADAEAKVEAKPEPKPETKPEKKPEAKEKKKEKKAKAAK